jgi:hypothetical protein
MGRHSAPLQREVVPFGDGQLDQAKVELVSGRPNDRANVGRLDSQLGDQWLVEDS